MIIEARGDVVSVRGTLDENHWDAIAAAVDLLLPTHPGGILMDCSGITSMTDMGAATFMDGLSYMEARGARIILCSVPGSIAERLRSIPGLHAQVPIARSVEQARSSLAASHAAPMTTRGKGRLVLLPVNPPFSARAGLSLLAHYQQGSGLHIHFIYVMVVPRSLPVGAPLPEEEERAEVALSEVEGAVTHTAVARHVTRGRNITDAVLEAVTKLDAAEVIVGLERDSVGDESTSTILDSLREKCPCTLTLTQAPSIAAVQAPAARR